MVRIIRSRLRNQILVSMLFVLAIPMLLHYAYLIQVTRNSIINNEAERLLNTAQIEAARMEAELERIAQEVAFFAETNAVKSYMQEQNAETTQRVYTLFTIVLENIEHYDHMRVLDENGHEVVRVQRNRDGHVFVVPEDELQDKSERDYFIHLSDANHVAPMHLMPLSLNREYGEIEIPYKPMIRIGLIIENAPDDTHYIIVNILAETFWDSVQPTINGERAFVIAPNGDYLKADNPDLLFGTELQTDINYPHVDQLVGSHGSFTIEATATEPQMLAAYQTVEINVYNHFLTWYIVYQRPYDDLLVAFNDNLLSLLPLGVLSIVIVMFVGLWLSERIARPLRVLNNSLSRFGREGEWTVAPAALASADEVGQLSRTVQNMALELRNLYGSLEELIDARTKQLSTRTQELKDANEQLHEVDRQKANLLNNFAHDIRTPMTALFLKFDLMERRPDKLPQYLSDSRRQVQRIEELLNNVQDIARFDAIPKTPTFDTVNFHEIIIETATLHTDYAAEHGVILSIDISENLPPILGVSNMLSQVVDNLVVNAIKYNQEGGDVLVRCWHDTDTNSLMFTVADTGRGIDEVELPNLFKRFYRTMDVRQTKIPGTGLGLAIVYDVVKLHGGTIEVQSVKGSGTIFTVRLPVPTDSDKA